MKVKHIEEDCLSSQSSLAVGLNDRQSDSDEEALRLDKLKMRKCRSKQIECISPTILKRSKFASPDVPQSREIFEIIEGDKKKVFEIFDNLVSKEKIDFHQSQKLSIK